MGQAMEGPQRESIRNSSTPSPSRMYEIRVLQSADGPAGEPSPRHLHVCVRALAQTRSHHSRHSIPGHSMAAAVAAPASGPNPRLSKPAARLRRWTLCPWPPARRHRRISLAKRAESTALGPAADLGAKAVRSRSPCTCLKDTLWMYIHSIDR